MIEVRAPFLLRDLVIAFINYKEPGIGLSGVLSVDTLCSADIHLVL